MVFCVACAFAHPVGGKYKSKHKRWFILKENVLYYFKQPTVSCRRATGSGQGRGSVSNVCLSFLQDNELIGSIPLIDDDLRVRNVDDPKTPVSLITHLLLR